MRSKDIHEFVAKQPFQPFRITLTDGRTYDVRHPEMAMVGKSSVVIGVPLEGDDEPYYDRAITVALIHIMQAEVIDGAVQN